MPANSVDNGADAFGDVEAAIHDPERLSHLQRTGLLDSAPEASFDRLTRLAALTLGTSAALVTLIDEERQFFLSQYGLREPWATTRQSPLSHSLCRFAVASKEPLVVGDLAATESLREHPAVTELGFQAYAGAPLLTTEGLALGAFCVLDSKAREWTDRDLEILGGLAAMAATEIDLRLANRTLAEKHSEMQDTLKTASDAHWEAEIARSRLESVLDSSPDAIVLISDDGRATMVNRGFAALGGPPPDHVTGQSIAELQVLLAQRYEEAGLRDLGRLFASPAGEPKPASVTLVELPPGRQQLSVTSAPVYDSQGGRLGLVFRARDVTHEREVDRMKTEFVSLVSHEFRTPLTGILGFSELLRDEELPPELVHEYAADIQEDAQRLSRLVNDMLDLDRLESGRVELQREWRDLGAIVREAAESAERGQKRRITLDCGESPPLFIDHDRILRAVLNLVSNALKYSPGAEPVEISMRTAGPLAVVTVADHGIGIPAAALDQVFERYRRVESGAARKIQGTGLGLPIARRIVQLHGGDITATSREGEGSTFVLSLPIQPDSTVS